jgi:hypothetical protein
MDEPRIGVPGGRFAAWEEKRVRIEDSQIIRAAFSALGFVATSFVGWMIWSTVAHFDEQRRLSVLEDRVGVIAPAPRHALFGTARSIYAGAGFPVPDLLRKGADEKANR